MGKSKLIEYKRTNEHSCIFCELENECSLEFPLNIDNNDCIKWQKI